MSKFFLGVIVTVLIIVIGGAAVVLMGLMPTSADATPPRWESRIAHIALDNAMEKNAPRLNNPIPPTDENLIDGMKTYVMACAECHGGLDRKPSPMVHSFYPAELHSPPHRRPLSGMYCSMLCVPAFVTPPCRLGGKTMSETDMWKVTSFITRVDKLSPAVQDFWKRRLESSLSAESEAGHEHHDHADHK
jgi:hypothetical protein